MQPPTKAHCFCTVWWSDFPRRGGALRETTSKDRFSARFIAYEASSHRTSPRGSSWVQALPGKFRGNHNPGFDRGNFCPFPGAYLGSHTPGIPGISGSTWEHTHPGAYSGRETRVFPGGRWEPRSQPRSWPRKNPGTGWIPGFSRVVLLGVVTHYYALESASAGRAVSYTHLTLPTICSV